MLFQPKSVIIVEPVGQRLFKRPVERIATLCQFLAANVCRNLKFPYTGEANPHRCAHRTNHRRRRHDDPVWNHRNRFFQPRHFFHCLHNMLNGVGRLVATIIEFCAILVIFQTEKHKPYQLLHVDTRLDGILTSRIGKLSPTDTPIKAREVTILSPSKHHARAYNSQLAICSSSLPRLMNLFRHQFRYAVCRIRRRQCKFRFLILCRPVWSDRRSEYHFLIP